MDWDTLIAVVIGGLIGIVSNYFTNHFQLKNGKKKGANKEGMQKFN